MEKKEMTPEQRLSVLEEVERAILDGIPKKDKYIFTSTLIKDETHKREDNEPFTAEGWNSCRHTLLKLIKKLMEKWEYNLNGYGTCPEFGN